MAEILNIGSLNLDHVYQVDHFVQPGETLSASAQSVLPGGKGLNQSIALARAGAPVSHAGCFGRGGEWLKSLLEESGVRTEHLLPVDALQGNAVIQVDPTGENCILLFGGSNQCLTAAQVDKTLSAFSPGDWLVLQNEVNDLNDIVDQASARGLCIALNPSPFNAQAASIDFGKLTWLLVNRIEAAQISGSEDPFCAWAALHERFPSLSVAITLGSKGSLAWRVSDGAVEYAEQPAFPVRAVDTTGAGDTFTGYFLAALLEGQTLQAAMQLASMASAISITRPGAARSIPHRAEVEAALVKNT